MAVDYAKFVTDFPEFANATTYPKPTVEFYLALGGELLGPRWGTLISFGLELFVAHNLSVEYEARRAAARGQNPGAVMSPVTGGSVDKVSYQRAAGSILDPKNGHWNLSQYGLRYIQLVKMVGAGPVQVHGAGAGGDVFPWAGPGINTTGWP